MTLRAAEQHYRTQAALAVAVVRQVDRYWRQVSPDDINSWRRAAPAVERLVFLGQFTAARGAERYVSAALDEQGIAVRPDAAVQPVAFAGMANGPAAPSELIDLPRIQALEAVAAGTAPKAALSAAGARLQTYVASLVQDAGRQADSAATFVRPQVGWRRMVNPPCCERCAILAGKWFRSNEGFLRHPRCDCRHIPAPEDAPGDIGTDPRALFASGQVRGLRGAEARAIADGADPAQVVNARRGAQGMFTTEGTTRRGVAGARGVRSRPTPDAIYARATSRDDALELLRANGYIT